MNKENRPAADLFPTDEEDTGGPPASSGSPSTWEHKFFGDFGKTVEFFEQEEDEVAVECEHYIVDNTKQQYVTAQSHILTAGASTSELVCKYSPTLTLGDMADLVVMPLRTANAVVPRVTSPILMPDDAKVKKLLLKLYRRGGNATLSPEMWNFIVSAASGRPPTTPGGTPPDLPTGAPWGNIVWDTNAASEEMKALYGDGDDVNNFLDSSVTGYDATTTATLLLPKYRTDGIATGVPCVEWDGANAPLTVSNPTQPYGNWTYYFVIANLDGGDGANILANLNGYPFGLDIDCDGGSVFAQVNTNAFGSTYCTATDTWGMLDIHIYRWSKDSSAVRWNLWVDGELVCYNSANPQNNDTTLMTMMNYSTGLGMTGKWCRGVAYDTNHNNGTTASGAVASGLTPIEEALRTFWGTP